MGLSKPVITPVRESLNQTNYSNVLKASTYIKKMHATSCLWENEYSKQDQAVNKVYVRCRWFILPTSKLNHELYNGDWTLASTTTDLKVDYVFNILFLTVFMICYNTMWVYVFLKPYIYELKVELFIRPHTCYMQYMLFLSLLILYKWIKTIMNSHWHKFTNSHAQWMLAILTV